MDFRFVSTKVDMKWGQEEDVRIQSSQGFKIKYSSVQAWLQPKKASKDLCIVRMRTYKHPLKHNHTLPSKSQKAGTSVECLAT